MTYSQLHNNVRKISALIAAILILPALTYASQNGQGQNGQGQNGQGQNGQGNMPVPEANAGIVLIPFVGAVLLFSARQLLRAKAAQKGGC